MVFPPTFFGTTHPLINAAENWVYSRAIKTWLPLGGKWDGGNWILCVYFNSNILYSFFQISCLYSFFHLLSIAFLYTSFPYILLSSPLAEFLTSIPLLLSQPYISLPYIPLPSLPYLSLYVYFKKCFYFSTSSHLSVSLSPAIFPQITPLTISPSISTIYTIYFIPPISSCFLLNISFSTFLPIVCMSLSW